MKSHGTYKTTTTKDRKCVKVHRVLVEKLLGKPLPKRSEIHHIDYNKSNNINSNLVVCPNRSYHKLLHQRQETLEAGFDPNLYYKCTDCKTYKEYEFFSLNKTRCSGYNNLCKTCDNTRNNERYRRLKFAL